MRQERRVEYQVIEILEAAGASEYLSQFARHRISIETLVQMTDEDLARVRFYPCIDRKFKFVNNFIKMGMQNSLWTELIGVGCRASSAKPLHRQDFLLEIVWLLEKYIVSITLFGWNYILDIFVPQIGIHELGLRRAILKEVENFLETKKLNKQEVTKSREFKGCWANFRKTSGRHFHRCTYLFSVLPIRLNVIKATIRT